MAGVKQNVRGVERLGQSAASGDHFEIGELYFQNYRPCLEPEFANFPAYFLGLRKKHLLKLGDVAGILGKGLFGADRFGVAVRLDRRIIYSLRLCV